MRAYLEERGLHQHLGVRAQQEVLAVALRGREAGARGPEGRHVVRSELLRADFCTGILRGEATQQQAGAAARTG